MRRRKRGADNTNKKRRGTSEERFILNLAVQVSCTCSIETSDQEFTNEWSKL